MNWYIHYKKADSKELFILRAPAGSGKSTLTNSILQEHGISDPMDHVFSTDNYPGLYSQDPQGNRVFRGDLLGVAHKNNLDMAIKAMEQGVSPIIIDNTNTQRREFFHYIIAGKKYGYKIDIREPNWSPELKTPEGKWNFDFLKGRSIHQVPEAALKKMLDRYEYGIKSEDFE